MTQNFSLKNFVLTGLLIGVCAATAFASGSNDSPSGATVMYVNNAGTGTVDYDGDPVDWWKVTVGEVGDLKFTLEVPSGQDFDLKIYSSSAPSGYLGGSARGTGSDEEVTISMFYCGPYYAKVYTYGSSSGSYRITNEVIQTNTIPRTPTPSSPSDGAVITDITPYLNWSSFQHGGDGNSQNGYQVRVRCDTDGDSIVYDTGYISSGSGSSHTYSPGSYSGYDSTSGSTRVSNDLQWGKHYHWHVRYRDSSGDWGEWSSDTPNPYQDFYTNSSPDVNIISPGNGSTVSGTVTIQVDGWDNEDSTLDKIKYYIDNTLKYTDDNPLAACPASTWNWNTTGYSSSSHTIKAIGYDFNGWTDTHEITVTVNNNTIPLTPTPSSPSDEAVITDITPYFSWSSFQHGGDGDTQNGYQVRVRCDTDGDALVYDTGYISSSSGSSHTYSPGSYSGYDFTSGSTRVSNDLQWGKHYHWHVRYRDSSGDWGAWSSDDPSPHQDFYTSNTNLSVNSFQIDDDKNGGSNGNGNGQPDPGESIELHILLENVSDVAANNVTANLTSLASEIIVTDSYEIYGNIAIGEVKGCGYDFDFKIPSDYSGPLEFQLAIQANNNAYNSVKTVTLSSTESKGIINITAVDQTGQPVYPGELYVNGVSSGSLDSLGKFSLADLGIGCYGIKVKDDLGHASDVEDVFISSNGDVKEIILTVYQTKIVEVNIPTGLSLAPGEERTITIGVGIEASGPGTLWTYLYTMPSQPPYVDYVYLNSPGSYLKNMDLSTVAPDIPESCQQQRVEVVFDPDGLGIENTSVERQFIFNVAEEEGLIEWVKIINSSNQELDHELYKFEVYDHQIRIKTSEDATVTWGGRTFDTLNSVDNIYYYNLLPDDLQWGEWDEDTPGIINNILIEAVSSSGTENKTISVEARQTTTDRTSYHFAQFTEAFNAVSEVGDINLAQNILKAKSELVSTGAWRTIGQFDWMGDVVDIKMKVSLTRDTGKYAWETIFLKSSDPLHYSIVNGDRVHVHGTLPGGVRIGGPARGSYWVDDLVKVEVAGDGRIYRALFKKGTEPSFSYDVPDFDSRFIKTRPTPAAFDTLDDAVDDAAGFFATYKSWKVPKQSLSGKFKVGIHNRLKGLSRWGKYVRWAGWIIEGGTYVWEVNDILQAAHGDKFEQIVEVTGERLGCIGGAQVLSMAGAKIGLYCGVKAYICSPAFAIAGGIGGCLGGIWGGEKVSRYTYRVFVEGQEVSWQDLKDESYYYLTQFCDQINSTSEEDYRCYHEDGSSFIVTKFDREGPDAYVTYDEPDGQLPNQTYVPIVPIDEDNLYTKTYKDNWVKVTKIDDYSYIRTPAQPSNSCKVINYDLDKIELPGPIGGEAKFLVGIKNIRDVHDTYAINLDTSNLPAGWSASIDQNSVVIGPKDAYNVLVAVNIPVSADDEDTGTVFVTAASLSDSTMTNTIELVACVDGTMPIVELNNVEDGQVVYGSYDVYGSVADVSPSVMDIRIDGESVGIQLPYTWNTAVSLSGYGVSANVSSRESNDDIHTLEVVVTDLAGNSQNMQISVEVDNPPLIIIDLPEDNAIVDDTDINIVGIVDDPALVSVDLTVNGSVSPLTLSGSSFNAPVTLMPGLNNINITAEDAFGNTSSKSIVVRLNSSPVFEALSDISVPENTLIEFQVTAADVDKDTLSFTDGNLPIGATFNTETKTFMWTPTYDDAGTYSEVHFEVTDGSLTDSENITIAVANVNRVPDISAIPDTITKDEAQTITKAEVELATDPDGTALTYSYSGWKTSLPYTTTYEDSGDYILHVDVTDGEYTVGKDILITVKHVNRLPVITSIPDIITKNETESITKAEVELATDPDTGTTLSYTYTNWKASLPYTTTYEDAGSYVLRVTVSDGDDSVFKDIAVTVSNVNRLPVITAIPNTITKNEAQTITKAEVELATDPDSGTTLSYTYSNWRTSLPYTTTYEDAGSYTLHVDVTDGEDTVGKDILVAVNNVNRAPILNPISDIAVNEAEAITLSPTGADPDGDSLTFTYSGWMTNSSYTTTYDDSGVHTVTVTVTDGTLIDSQDITITVNDVDITSPDTNDNYNGSWSSQDFTIYLSATDAKSSIKDTYYRINDGSTYSVNISGQPLISTEGNNNSLEYWSVDTSDNEELPHNILTGIKLDKVSPIVTISNPEDKVAFDLDVPITVTGEVTDALSGVGTVGLDIDGTAYTAAVELDGSFLFVDVDIVAGPNNITASAQDAAGNGAQHSILVFNGSVLHLNIPYYEVDSYYSGAACAQMVLNYMRDGVASDLTQEEIYNYGHPYNYPENSSLLEMDPQAIDYTLGHFDPYDASDPTGQGISYKAYNFTIEVFESDKFTEYLRDIIHWIDFPVTIDYWWLDGDLVAQPNVPGTVPAYGTYDHWIVVNGAAVSEDPMPEPHTNPQHTPDFTVYGLWLTDPASGGIGQDIYVTAQEAQDTYLLPVVSSDYFNGKFVQVAEPPPELSNAEIEIAESKPNGQTLKVIEIARNITEDISEYLSPYEERLENVRRHIYDAALVVNLKNDAKSNSDILFEREKDDLLNLVFEFGSPAPIELDWRKIVAPSLLTDEDFVEAFNGSQARSFIKVGREDKADDFYYLIPFDKYVRGEFLTYSAIMIDAQDGSFKAASWVEEPTRFIQVSKEAAEALALRDRIENGVISELIWQAGPLSESPFYPYWKVTIGSDVYYVTQDGEVVTQR